eukprot:TRINITY_DN31905_c0_g1_i1.p2 TRINITY_DN31905_c0_g1~~TRINITY_DN31905_c0_g1_i1.p2  ORF type:complete len:110 (-),score=6.76 TRINITY_DN31905_c0_g1_i1:555-884(-)
MVMVMVMCPEIRRCFTLIASSSLLIFASGSSGATVVMPVGVVDRSPAPAHPGLPDTALRQLHYRSLAFMESSLREASLKASRETYTTEEISHQCRVSSRVSTQSRLQML